MLRSGKRKSCGPIDAFLLPGSSGRPRAAIVVPRFGHTAVERNRLKRRLREIVRLCWLPGADPLDLVLRARPSAYGRGYSELKERFLRCLDLPTC